MPQEPTPPSEPASPEITSERIRVRAYEIWDRNHRPDGFEMRFWLAAERELRAERERASAAQVRRSRTDDPEAGD